MSVQQANGSMSGAFFALVRRDLLLAFRRPDRTAFPGYFPAGGG